MMKATGFPGIGFRCAAWLSALLAAVMPVMRLHAAPSVYPYDLAPSTYPDYTRRVQPVPDWSDFHGAPQFAGVRYTTVDEAYFTERWASYTVSFTPTNDGIATFSITNESCDGTVLVDDVQAGAAGGTNLLANPGFETVDPAQGWRRTGGAGVYQDGHASKHAMLIRRGHALEVDVSVVSGQVYEAAFWLSVAGRSEGQVVASFGGAGLGTANLAVTDETTENPSGLVYWPQVQLIINNPGISAATIDSWTNHGVILHNPGGYGPGTPWVPNFGQCLINTNSFMALTNRLGVRFTGGDIGEQDGRFANVYETCYEPFSVTDRFLLFKAANRYQGQCADDLGNLNSLLVNLWLWHYPVKEGHVTISGVQAQPKAGIGNSQVQYAFVRGAGKQYGVPWWGNVSIFSTDWQNNGKNYKSYPTAATNGISLGLMRRLLVSQYLYGCRILSIEGNERDDGGAVSPIGTVHEAMVQTINQYGIPGVMHAPVALLLDYWSGWMPARYNRGNYYVWSGVNYDQGDFLTHNLFSMLYPDYEANGFYQNERGGMASTPYGDQADALLTDVTAPILSRYGVAVAAGNLRTAGPELRDKVESYAAGGGSFLVTGENARRLWPAWNLGTSQVSLPAGAVVNWADSSTSTEPYAGVVYSVDLGLLPPGASVLASYGGTPVVVRVPLGTGEIVLLLSPYGLNQSALSSVHPSNANNTMLSKPYVLMNHVQHLLADRFAAQRLFSVNNSDLCYITCRRGPGDYLVGVMNNNLTSQVFEIRSQIGAITNLVELDLGPAVTNKTGYWPFGYEGNNGGLSGPTNIFGGDTRLFRVQVAETNTIRLLGSNVPPARPVNRLVAVPALSNLKDTIQQWPTFSDHFDGVKLDWKSVAAADLTVGDGPLLVEPVRWLIRRQLRFITDAGPGILAGELTLNTNAPGTNYAHSVAVLGGIMDKLALLGRAGDLVIAMEDVPTNEVAFFRAGVAALCADAAVRGVTVHLRHRATAWSPDVASTLAFLDTVGASNLLFAAATADAQAGVGALLAQAGGRLGLILVTAPTNGAALDLSPVRTSAVPQVLDADYSSWDTLYRDIVATWVTNGPAVLAGAPVNVPAEVAWSIASTNRLRYWTAKDVTDLPATLRRMTNFWRYFGGVKVDYKYLAFRDAARCAEEGQWLRDRGVGLVVDFSSDLNNYPGMTLADSTTPDDGLSANYDRSMATLNEVFAKMQAMGVTNALIRPTMRNNAANLASYRVVCTNAWARGHIMLHMQHSLGNWVTRSDGSYDTPANVASLIDAIAAPNGNLKMAVNGCHNSNLAGVISTAGGRLGLILLGYPAGPSADQDVHGAARLGMSTSALAGRTEPQILDSEYADWNDTALDLAYLGWTASNSNLPPEAPSGVYAGAGDSLVTVGWTAAPGATGYVVKRSLASGGPYMTLADPVAAPPYADAAVTNGATYFYVVSATNVVGVSPDSAEVSATPSTNIAPILAWSGAFGGVWDTSTTNWLSGGTPALFTDGDAALFSDAASGTTTVTLSAARSPAYVIVSNAAKGYAISGSAMIGAGSLTKAGAGTLLLGSANSYGGGTIHRGGTLTLGNAGALGSGPLTLTGGVLQNAGNYTIANPVVLAGTGSAVRLGSANNLTVSGPLTGGGSVTVGDSAFISSVYLAGANTMSSGTITLAGNQNYVRFSSASAGNSNVDWVIHSTPAHGTFDFATGTIHFGSLAGSGFIEGNIAGADSMNITIVAGANGRSTTFSGVIRDNGWGTGPIGLTKTGPGTLTLAGSNSYSGTTRVEAGALVVSTVSRTKGDYVVSTGATLAVNNVSGGSVPMSNLWLNAGAIIEFQNLASTSTPLVVATNTTATGPGAVRVSGAGGLIEGRTYPLIRCSGSLAGASNLVLQMPYGWRGALSGTTNQLLLTSVASVSTSPADLAWSMTQPSGRLVWAADHIGWRLQVQTNLLSGPWTDLPGTEGTNEIPLAPGQGDQFYRLVYP